LQHHHHIAEGDAEARGRAISPFLPFPVWKAAFLQRCPHCGKASLFEGLLKVTSRCKICSLDFSGEDAGDGPAFFAITIIGTLATLLATLVHLMFRPPYWVHSLLWGPFIIGGSILVLRICKAWLVAEQFRLKRGVGEAHEAQIGVNSAEEIPPPSQ
jgi:uncharacterized protein (DUF983 family)